MGIIQGRVAVTVAANEPCWRVREGGRHGEMFVALSLGNGEWSRWPGANAGGRVTKTEHGLLGN